MIRQPVRAKFLPDVLTVLNRAIGPAPARLHVPDDQHAAATGIQQRLGRAGAVGNQLGLVTLGVDFDLRAGNDALRQRLQHLLVFALQATLAKNADLHSAFPQPPSAASPCFASVAASAGGGDCNTFMVYKRPGMKRCRQFVNSSRSAGHENAGPLSLRSHSSTSSRSS